MKMRKIFMFGDFNFPIGISSDYKGQLSKFDKDIKIVFDIMLTPDLVEFVKEPTRIQGSSTRHYIWP